MEFAVTLIIIGGLLLGLAGALLVDRNASSLFLIPFVAGSLAIAVGVALVVADTSVSIRHKQYNLACGGNLGYYDQDGKFQSSNNTILKMMEVTK